MHRVSSVMNPPSSLKENVQPRASRVVWCEFDTKSACPTPSRRSQPLKPILKNSTQRLVNNSSVNMPPKSAQAPATPSTIHDLPNDLQYILQSPLETLLETLSPSEPDCISLHDLAEAYNILLHRIRYLLPSLVNQPLTDLDKNPTASIFSPLRAHASQFLQCLQRDIRRVLIDPRSLESSSNPYSMGYNSVHPETNSDSHDMTVEEIQYARDLCTVSHNALHLLSVIFTFLPLRSVFPETSVAPLFSTVLNLAYFTLSFLPTPSSRKTRAIVYWILRQGAKHLPLSTIASNKREVIASLKSAIEELCVNSEQVILDALETLRILLTTYPSTFLPQCTPLLPLVLGHLLSSFPDVRSQAAYTLSGFVQAKVYILSTPIEPGSLPSSTVRSWDNEMSGTVQSFIKFQVRASKFASKRKGNSSTPVPYLPDIISTALSSSKENAPTSPQNQSQTPAWALSTIASLIVLCDFNIFNHPPSLKLCILSIAQASGRHQRSAVRSLSPHVWRCFVWVLGRLLAVQGCIFDEGGDSYESGEGKKIKAKDTEADTQNPAFLVVRQELKDGTGMALVGCLLGSTTWQERRGFDRVAKALKTVKDMVSSDNLSTSKDGVDLLTRLSSAIGVGQASAEREQGTGGWDLANVLTPALFDGTILRARSISEISAAVSSMSSVDAAQVRQLSEEEIVRYWDELMEIWVISVEKLYSLTSDSSTSKVSTKVSASLKSELLLVWQSLLLVQAQLTQGHGHLTTLSSVIADRITSIIAGFLRPLDIPELSNAAQVQLDKLTLITSLWSVLKNVFSMSCLAALAGFILVSVLQRVFHLSDDKVKGAWSALCADLVVSSDIHLDISRSNVSEPGIEVQRQLWGMVMKTPAREGQWKDLVSLLVIPLGKWFMNESELELWDRMLRSIIRNASSKSVRPIQVIEHILESLGSDKVARIAAYPKVLTLLLPYVNLEDSTDLPVELLSVINEVLSTLYPPPAALRSTCLECLHLTSDIVSSAPLPLLVSTLVALQQCLCSWIEDDQEIIPEEEYNITMTPLYRKALEKLRPLPLSHDTILSLSTFFASTFNHIPWPAQGPLDFEAYWRSTYYGLEEFFVSYPKCLKDCLRAYDVWHRDLAAGLSPSSTACQSQSQSQSQSQPQTQHQSHVQTVSTSTVPDSQPSGVHEINSREYNVDHSRNSGANNTIGAHDSREPVILQVATSMQGISVRNNVLPIKQPSPPLSDALRQLQDYVDEDTPKREMFADQTGNTSNSKSIHGVPFNPFSGSNPAEKPGMAKNDLKRSLVDTGKNDVKRRRLDPPESTASHRPVAMSSSAPTTRAVSPKSAVIRTASQPSLPRTKPVSDRVELLNHELPQGPFRTPEPTTRFYAGRRPPFEDISQSTYDDYDSWDAGMTSQQIKDSLGDSSSAEEAMVPDTDGLDDSFVLPNLPSRQRTEPLMNESLGLRSPSVSAWSRQRGCSQPVPRHGSSIPATQSSTALHREPTSSARLEALRQAYAVVTDDASQIPVEDLVQATRLVHQIGTALNEQMSRKLADVE